MFPGVLSVVVMHAGNDFRVTYSQTYICAVKGSTVSLYCDVEPQGQEAIWVLGSRSVDLKADLQYLGRVKNYSNDNWRRYTVEISDLRESDSAEYKCKVTTKPPNVESSGSRGVSLSVTGDAASLLLTGKIQIILTCHSD